MRDDGRPPEELDAGERAEALGWEAFIRAMPDGLGSADPGTWRIGDALGFGVDVEPHALFNRVIGLGTLAPATTETLDAALAPWRGMARQTIVHAMPGPAGEDLAAMLEARGYQPGRQWLKHVRAASPTPTPAASRSVRVDEIGLDQARAFADTAARLTGVTHGMPWFEATVGRPGWHTYLAFDANDAADGGGEPVYCGQLYVADELGWLFNGEHADTDRPDAQAAIAVRRVADGMALGCRWLVSETGEPDPGGADHGAASLAAAGFRVAYRRRNWIGIAGAPIEGAGG